MHQHICPDSICVNLHWVVEEPHLTLWLSTATMTFAMAPLVGSTLTWLDQHMDVQGLVGSIFFMTVKCGSSMGPFIVGRLISDYGYQIFTDTLVFDIALLLATNIVMQVFSSKCGIN